MNSNAVLKLMGRGGVRGGGPPRGPGRGGLRGQYNYYYWLIIDKREFGHRFSWLNNSYQWYENCATDCICQFFILVLDLHCILLPDSLTDYKMVVAQLLLTQQLTLWPTNKDRNIPRLRFPAGQR